MATEADKSKERQTLLRQAYGQATQDLREKHREDFDKFYEARATELGVEWKPRPTPEQKAQEEFDSLLEKFPQLAGRVRQVVPVEEGATDEGQ